MKIRDLVMVVDSESIPESFLGSFGVVTDVNDYKVTVKFKGSVKGIGGLSHTAFPSDLKVIGEVVNA
jgi:hypothetical protein